MNQTIIEVGTKQLIYIFQMNEWIDYMYINNWLYLWNTVIVFLLSLAFQSHLLTLWRGKCPLRQSWPLLLTEGADFGLGAVINNGEFTFTNMQFRTGITVSLRPVHVLLSRFYLDFILILFRFYLDFILILSRFFQNSLYPNFIQILS